MNTHNRKALAAKVWEVVDSRTATICATDLTQVQASKIAKQMDIGDDGRFQVRRMDQSPEAVLGRHLSFNN